MAYDTGMQSYDRENEGDSSRAEWLRQIHDARSDARQIKRRIPPEIPESVINPPRIIRAFHAAVLDYADHIRPKKSSLGELWSEELADVSVPPGGVTAEATPEDLNHAGELQRPPSEYIYDVEWTEESVSLEDLGEQWDGDNKRSFSVLIPTSNGYADLTETTTLYLPPHASKACYRQLDQCLDHLGWTPKASVQAIEAMEPLNPNPDQ